MDHFKGRRPIGAEGVHVWRYLGGPWEAVATVGFEG